MLTDEFNTIHNMKLQFIDVSKIDKSIIEAQYIEQRKCIVFHIYVHFLVFF
jgi:hypothetical protein